MSLNLHKILKALAKELTVEVTNLVTQQLRESYVEDVTGIVKQCLNNDEIYKSSGVGYLTIQAVCEKYKVSRKTVTDKCTLFGIERKKSGKHRLVNEVQFLDALQRPVEKPKFLTNQKAA